MEQMEKQAETKRLNTGKIGFIFAFATPFSLVALPAILLSVPLLMNIWVILTIPTVLLLLSAIYCIHGLVRNRNRKLASAGLILNITIPFLLFFAFIEFTPPGLMPYPLNFYKFKRALECDFWLDYDKKHIIDVQSQNTIIISKQGAIHFQSATNTYQKDSVIKYAEDNGWKYHLSVKLTQEDFEKYEKEKWDWDVINVLRPSPIILKKDCTVLVFETGHIHGMASYIMISEDLSEMVVFFYNARLPDPAMKFWISEGFKELNKIQSEQEEQVNENQRHRTGR